MLEGPGGFDDLFGPRYRLVNLDQITEEPRVRGDGGCHDEVAVVGGHRNAVRKLANSAAA